MTLCEDCHTDPALPDSRKCYACRDLQLQFNSNRKYFGHRQCVFCGEQTNSRADVCPDCRSRGARIDEYGMRQVRYDTVDERSNIT